MGINYKDFLLREKVEGADSTSAWTQLEEKTGLKFFLKDGEFRPVNEWLDDLYIQFTEDQAKYILEYILENGEILFADLLKHRS